MQISTGQKNTKLALQEIKRVFALDTLVESLSPEISDIEKKIKSDVVVSARELNLYRIAVADNKHLVLYGLVKKYDLLNFLPDNINPNTEKWLTVWAMTKASWLKVHESINMYFPKEDDFNNFIANLKPETTHISKLRLQYRVSSSNPNDNALLHNGNGDWVNSGYKNCEVTNDQYLKEVEEIRSLFVAEKRARLIFKVGGLARAKQILQNIPSAIEEAYKTFNQPLFYSILSPDNGTYVKFLHGFGVSSFADDDYYTLLNNEGIGSLKHQEAILISDLADAVHTLWEQK